MAGTAKPIKIDIIKNECGLRLNEELLKNELNNSEIEEALSNNKESDIYEIAARYNSRYFFDDIWVTATSNEGHKGEFNAHELLRLLFYSPDQYEDECLDVTTQSEFIFIQASVAGGQGGGLAIKNIRNNEWVFTTNEFSVQAILYVPKKKLFIGYTNVTTYAWATMYLSLITLKGDVTTLSLFSRDNLKNGKERNNLLEDFETEFSPESDIVYDEKEDFIYFLQRWRCKLTEVIEAAES